MLTYDELTPTERELWDAFPEGRWVDLRTGISAEDDPTGGDGWGTDRSVRATVVTGLLLRGNDRSTHAVAALRLAGARITGRIDLEGAEVLSPLCLDGCWLEEQVRLSGASTRMIRMTGTRVPGIDARSARIDGQFDLRRALVENGRVTVVNARITGEFDLCGASLRPPENSEALNVSDAIVEGALLCRDGFVARGQTVLLGAELRTGILMEGARLESPDGSASVLADRATFGCLLATGIVADGTVRLRGVQVGDLMTFEGATLADPDVALDCTRLQAGDLDIRFGVLPSGALDLRDARVGVLHDTEFSWPQEIRLDGFTYNAIDTTDGAVWDTVAGRITWIRRSRGYAPQPYEQLAGWYRQVGHDADARRVLLAKQRHRRRTLHPAARAWGYLLDATVGYGYRPWLAGLWLTALIALGSAVFSTHSPAATKPGEGQPFNPVAYTLDLLIPIGGLGQREAWHWTTPGTQWLAYVLIAAGWMLTTAVVAGVTRTLNKN
ncbi:oxidoreductase [Streptomyces sp. NPDC019443]|uniref:oxidoreductase n=1 Tax=Streptomyces sp. NPDC019443 TaxID=3365061 RepID=UPI00379C6D3B